MLTVEINTTSRPHPLSHSLSSPSLAETGLAYIIGEVGRRVEPIPTTGKCVAFFTLYLPMLRKEEPAQGRRSIREPAVVYTQV
jgi:hypothetical protein